MTVQSCRTNTGGGSGGGGGRDDDKDEIYILGVVSGASFARRLEQTFTFENPKSSTASVVAISSVKIGPPGHESGQHGDHVNLVRTFLHESPP